MRRTFLLACAAWISARIASAQTRVVAWQIQGPPPPGDDRLAALMPNGTPQYIRLGSGLTITPGAAGQPGTLTVSAGSGAMPDTFQSGSVTGPTVTLPAAPCDDMPIAVYRNGLRQDASDGITRNGVVVTFTPPLADERVVIDFWKLCGE